MAHRQQADFCKSVKQHLPHLFSNRLVIDIGSLDINGNNQYLFDDCMYLGVDLMPGKNVDLAAKGHELSLPNECVDVVISTECFEHDQFYPSTLNNILRMIKPGGLFMFTCATTGRPEHGTRRSSPDNAPFTQDFGEWGDYYKNLEEADIRAVLDLDAVFDTYAFSTNPQTHDLYFWGVKKGTLIDRSDYSFQIHQSELRAALKSREAYVAELLETVSKRDAQVGSLNRSIQDISNQLRERDRQLDSCICSIRDLSNQLRERDKQLDARNRSIQNLSNQLEEMTGSKAWKIAMLVRKCRVAIAPPHSYRARTLRRLKNTFLGL